MSSMKHAPLMFCPFKKWQGSFEDDSGLPAAVDLLDGALMIGDSFDFRVDGMPGWIERFALHGGGQADGFKRREGSSAAEKAFGVVAVEQFAEPAYHEVFQVDGVNLDGYRLERANRRGVAHQVEHGPSGVGEQVR